ncbi:MAG: phosphomannomutase/phosphoglucomutase [Polyangiaceae bacterium]|jgi:phosphomannomutase/phosphoglucomutase|nr:phosphomannomutase/phosphoglucomutase [Polyangiaceae bacterium]
MQVPRHAFREYDIRGVAERDLTTPVAEAIGRGFGTLLGAPAGGGRPRVAVARDCRLSSPRLRDALVEGLLAAGCEVVDVGIGPSPLLYFAAHHLRTDGAVMVTGSHNPPDENGFKMMRGLAPFFGPDIVALRDAIEAGLPAARAGGSVRGERIDHAYVAALVAGVRLGPRPPFKVVLDAGNGAGGPLALRAFADCGVDVVPLHCEMDGTFPHHHPDPTQPENLRELIERVRATGARAGLAFDGDADRLGVVDEHGEVIWGDRLLLLFARRLLRERPGAAVLGEVKCSQVLYDDIAAHGGRPILWKTGHSLIKTKMKQEKALLAGEMSGHLFFADRWFGFDDAIYAALRFVELLAEEGKTPAELLADVPPTSVTPELRVPCDDALKFRAVDAILARYRQTHEVVDVDGARIAFGGGAWGLVRASNTQPVLVLRFEAENDARRDALRSEVEAALAEELARLA